MLGQCLWDWCQQVLAASTAVPGAGLTEMTFLWPLLTTENRLVRSTLKMRWNLVVKAVSIAQWEYSKKQLGNWAKRIYFSPFYLFSFIYPLTNLSGKPVTPKKIKYWKNIRDQLHFRINKGNKCYTEWTWSSQWQLGLLWFWLLVPCSAHWANQKNSISPPQKPQLISEIKSEKTARRLSPLTAWAAVWQQSWTPEWRDF